jgi:hypothetical protein
VPAVNASRFDRRRAARFAQLLEEANGGRRHHTRSSVDDQLTELVAVGQRLRSVTLPGIPGATFKRDLRAQLIATAEREGIGVTTRPEAGARRNAAWSARTLGRTRARGAIVIGIAAGTLALSGVSVASGEAIPGDALYGVKRQTEKAQLALAGSDLSRGRLHLEFAHTRLREAHAVREDATGFTAALTDMDSETTQGVRMLVASAMARRDTSSLDALDKFVGDQRILVGQLLDTSVTDQEKITGSLALLDRVEKRSAAARTALACGARANGSDKLGAVPGACADAAAQPSRAETQQNRDSRKSEAGTAPGAPAASAAPSASASPTAPAGEAAPIQDEGLLSELGRILGGLLG